MSSFPDSRGVGSGTPSGVPVNASSGSLQGGQQILPNRVIIVRVACSWELDLA